MTFDELMEIGRLRCKMLQYQRKKENAIELSSQLLNKSQKPYISVSGGKDSIAMVCLISEASNITKKPVRMWSHISDASFPGTIETIRQASEQFDIALDISESEVSAFDIIGQQSKQAFGKTGYFFDSVREYAEDKDCCFVGVRASESKRRMQAAKIHRQIFQSKSMGDVTVCHPILWFSLEDVFAALYEYDAPIHPIYRKKSIEFRSNSNKEQQFIRLGYVTATDLLNKGTAVFLKLNYPDIFYKLAEVYPEVKSYT